MSERVDLSRRQLVVNAARALAVAPLGLFAATASAQARLSRELKAIAGAAAWVNFPRLTDESLAGKVVLVDFCTYTCINWLRTLPHVRAWAAKYRMHGLQVVGIHTPEFGFEHDLENVRRAIARMAIDHPIALDNDYGIWRAFDNHHWPALYFIDARGRMRSHHFGEGEYERSERTIQRLLRDAGAAGVPADLVRPQARGVEVAADWDTLRSPENYLGYVRTENFASPGGIGRDRLRTYAHPKRLALNQWSLAGQWTMGKEAAVSSHSGGRLLCGFQARDLHLVAGSSQRGRPVRVRVTLDGQPPGPAHGIDVDESGDGLVDEPRLYQLIRQQGAIRDRLVEIEFLDAGADVFAFTFG